MVVSFYRAASKIPIAKEKLSAASDTLKTRRSKDNASRAWRKRKPIWIVLRSLHRGISSLKPPASANSGNDGGEYQVVGKPPSFPEFDGVGNVVFETRGVHRDKSTSDGGFRHGATLTSPELEAPAQPPLGL